MVSRSTRRSCLQCCVSRRTAEKAYLAVGRISMSGHGIETLSIPTWPKSVLRRGHSVLDNQDRNRARPDSENVATLPNGAGSRRPRSEEQTSELQSLMRNSYAVFCLKKKKTIT